MILSDFHNHSSYSGDSDSPMEIQIGAAINKGIKYLCITEHMDYDYPESLDEPDLCFILNVDEYKKGFMKNKEKFQKDINLFFGVELGLQPVCLSKNITFTNENSFDFIIGSSHICDGYDLYYPDYYEKYDDSYCYRRYFESILENIKLFNNFDVYGHLDYIVRYGKNKDRFYSYKEYSEIIDEILRTLIEMGKGIEINTGSFKSGLSTTNPHPDIIKRYKELKGEIITIGSDAHKPEFIGAKFDKAEEILKWAGFDYYTIFRERKPEFIKL